MASVTLAEMIGVYTITADELLGCFQSAGVRIDAILGALAPYETTPNTVPVVIADWGGAYTLDTTAKVQAVLSAAGIRGQSFMQQLVPLQD